MKGSRITAVALVAAAGLWIVSGHFLPHESGESRAAIRAGEAAGQKPFRVAVTETHVVPHRRKLTLSGRTEADKKVMAVARTVGILTELKVRRGSQVEKDDVIAVLSDEARVAQVAQAQALFDQRKAELSAKRRLIDQGNIPRLELVNLEAQYKAAEAALAAAQAERDRSLVLAPWSGVVTDVPAEVGQGLMIGKEIAHIVALDPIVAVVEVAERKLAGIKLGDPAEIRLVTGQTTSGRIRFVSKSASPATRTYRIEIEAANPDKSIPDGITAEATILLAPAPATRVPRSALTFSSAGDLGVRAVRADNTVEFIPVSVVEDEQTFMWVGGIADRARVIVQGQDFVREGQNVEAVTASQAVSEAR
jgi:multidrug efflux system membrane fusion protein